MKRPWLSIVGIGEDGFSSLSASARKAVESAGLAIGGKRHLAMLPPSRARRITWPKGLPNMLALVAAHRGECVCVLASGDPMRYGIGATLCARMPMEEVQVFPSPSAFALACARLGWAEQRTHCLSAHGRPVEAIRPFLYPGARLLLLTENEETAQEAAALLRAAECGESRMVALMAMGGAREARREGTANDPPEITEKLYTLAMEIVAGAAFRLQPRVPGLPDENFRHDGQLTKREMRAITLANLAPCPGAILWDVGAGAGSVAIEWVRAARGARAFAIERSCARVARARDNARALGAVGIEFVEGSAPSALAGLPAPDAIFIGGGLTQEVAERGWRTLRPGGRMVVNAVTLASERVAFHCHETCGGELARLAIARAVTLGDRTGWRPFTPVTQWRAVKPLALPCV